MKNIERIFCLLFVSFLIVACNGKKTSLTTADRLNTIPKDTLIELKSFAGKPDSILTKTELETKIKMIAYLEEHLKVVDNNFVLDGESQDFEKAGLSKYYYSLLTERFAELNHIVDSLGIDDLAEKYKEGSITHGMTLSSSKVNDER